MLHGDPLCCEVVAATLKLSEAPDGIGVRPVTVDGHPNQRLQALKWAPQSTHCDATVMAYVMGRVA